jgi:hypothetical protein
MVELIKPVGNLSEELLSKVENELGIRFPSDYRNFLLEHNGGRPSPAVFDIVWQSSQACGEDWKTSEVSRFFAIHDGDKANFLEMNKVDFRGRLPSETIAIAQDPGGNVILLAVKGPMANRVLFWVKDYEVEQGQRPGYENVGFVADSFDDFLNTKLR